MQTTRHALAILALLIAGVFAVQRPEATARDGACSDPLLVAFSADAQYDAACDAFTACQAYVEHFTPCTPHFYAERVQNCEESDVLCIAQAQLHTALIGLTVGNGYVDHGQPDDFWSKLAAKIADRDSIGAKTFDELELWYAPLAKNYGSHPMLDYSYAVLANLSGDTDAAAANFDSAVEEDSTNALIYLVRGDFHSAEGHDDLAALDYFITTAILGAPGLHEGLATLVTGRTSAYPFTYSAKKPYEMYPVLLTYEGPGGRAIVDNTMEPPIEMYLQQHGDLLLFIPGDIEAEREENPNRVLLPFYVMSETAAGDIYWSGTDYASGYVSRIRMIGTDLIFAGTRTDIIFEGMATQQFILVPAGSGDPRPQGLRCEGSPLSRLEDAVFATPLRWREPINLYDEPGGTATEIEQDSQMLIVLDGELECLDGYTWWPVKVVIDSKEQIGWIQENVDSTNYLYDRIDYD
jgi:hypothetical protein